MTSDRFAGLPPRPDPETGQPFPPHGRGWKGKDRSPEDDRDRETRLSHRPDPPSGKSPVLAWYKDSKRGKAALFLTCIAMFSVAMTFVSIVDGDPPLSWASLWGVWLGICVFSLLITRPLTYTVLSAGADWCQLQFVRFGVTYRRQFVKFYELRDITTVAGPTALYIKLSDDNDFIDLPRVEWQPDRRIWDLVYNGILHSVAAGAKVDANAHAFLELDQVQELRQPQGARLIDVTRLSDVHVWELMEDPSARVLCDSLGLHGSAAEFRKHVRELGEEFLTNPANPDWFSETDTQNTGSSDAEGNT